MSDMFVSGNKPLLKEIMVFSLPKVWMHPDAQINKYNSHNNLLL